MNCPRCRSPLYGSSKVCVTCGYSLTQASRELKRKFEAENMSNSPFINAIYRKLFGTTHTTTIRKVLKYFFVTLVLISLWYHFFIYIDIRNSCYITIRPALIEFSNVTMKKGLQYLKDDFPNEYTKVCKNVSTINPNISCGGFGGGCYSEYKGNPGVIDISTTYGKYKNAAKVIVHETCHAMQFNEGRPFDESECYKKDAIIPWE